MTLGDLLERVDIEKDRDKMILLDCGDGWANLTMTNNEFEPIYFKEDFDYDECMKAIHKFHEDALKGYLERPNPKLDESIRNLSDKELFLLLMLVLSDFMGQTENKPKEEEDVSE